MVDSGTPEANALEADAPLVEWDEKAPVSMPASVRRDLIQRPTVELETGLCGFFTPMNSLEELPLLRKGPDESR
jgi:hypothetical protein